MEKIVCTAVLFASLLGLSGCYVSKVREYRETNLQTRLKADQGILIAKVINASRFKYPLEHLTLTHEGVDESEWFRYSSIRHLYQEEMIASYFLSPIAAGNYSLKSLHTNIPAGQQDAGKLIMAGFLFSFAGLAPTYYMGSSFYKKEVIATPAMGTFKVLPGKVTNLGTIVYYKKYDGAESSDILLRKNQFDGAERLIKVNAARLYKDTDMTSMLGWDEDGLAEERYSKYLNAAQNPVTFSLVTSMNDGGWVFSASLGAYIERDVKGDWLLHKMGTDNSLISFRKDDHGNAVAVDSSGDLFFKNSGEGQWMKLDSPDEEGKIIYAGFGANNEMMIVVVGTRQLGVYTKKAGSNGGWRKLQIYINGKGWISSEKFNEIERQRLNKESIKFEDLNEHEQRKILRNEEKFHRKYRSASVLEFKERLHVLIDGNLYVLSGNDNKPLPLVDDTKLGKLEQVAPGQMVGTSAYLERDLLRRQYYSIDDGKSWVEASNRFDNCPEQKKKMNTPCKKNGRKKHVKRTLISFPVFLADGVGLSLMRSSDGKGSSILVTSKDDGYAWHEVENGKLPKQCNRLFLLSDSKRLMCVAETEEAFYTSPVEGFNWTLEYQNAGF